MPQPIIPVGQSDSYEGFFDNNTKNTKPLDEIALAQKYFARDTIADDSLALLEQIDKHDDNIVNAAVNYMTGNENAVYKNVPPSISDNLLLKLKAEGYIKGSGRTVTFTEKAAKALKNKYLNTDNKYKSDRVRKKII